MANGWISVWVDSLDRTSRPLEQTDRTKELLKGTSSFSMMLTLTGDGFSYLEAGSQTVGVVSAITAITQQHVVGVSFASADATASVEDGARPEDTSLQAGQVNKNLETHHSFTVLLYVYFISLLRLKKGSTSTLALAVAGY